MPWAEASLASSGSKARPTHLLGSYQSEPHANDIIPSGTVTARLHQLHGLAHPDQQSANTPLMDRDRENTLVVWGQRSACYFAHASYSQWLAAGSCLAHHDHSFVEHRSARNKHSNAHAVTRDDSGSHSCRLRISDCHACCPRGSLTLRNSLSAQQLRGPGTTAPSAASDDAVTVTGCRRREPARSLFEEYSIARPAGWLSDEEDLSLSGDGNASPQRFSRVCHVCAAQTRSFQGCPGCGHRLCRRCLPGVPSLGEESRQVLSHPPNHSTRNDESSHTQPRVNPPVLAGSGHVDRRGSKSWPARATSTLRSRPTWSVKENPFVVADKKAKNVISGQRIPGCGAAPGQGQTRKRVRDPQPESPGEEGPWECEEGPRECENAACRKTHEGHRPFRHSTLCALHRSSETGDTVHGPLESSATCDPIMEQVDEKEMAAVEALHAHHDTVHRHHSAGFHGPCHIAEHLSIAVGNRRHATRSKLAYQSSNSPESDERIIADGKGPITKPKVQAVASHLEPISSVQPIAEVDPFQYVEVPLLHGNDEARRRKTKEGAVELAASQRLDTPPFTQPLAPQTAHTLSQPLKHVELTKPLGGSAGVKAWLHGHSEKYTRAGSTEEQRQASRQAPPSELSEDGNERNGGRRVALSPRGWLQDTGVSYFDEKNTGQPLQPPKIPSPKFRQGSLWRRADASGKTAERRSASIQTYVDTLRKPVRGSLADAAEAIGDHSTEENAEKAKSPHIAIHRGSHHAERGTVIDQQISNVPKARIASPPAWLKAPEKQARDSFSRARHVKTHDDKNFFVPSQEHEAPSKHPSSLARPNRHHIDSSEQTSKTKNDERTSSKDTSAVSLGTTKRFQKDSGTWLGRRPELEIQTRTQANPKFVSPAPQPRRWQREQKPRTAERQATPLHTHTRSVVSDRCIFCEEPTPTPSIGHAPHFQGHSDKATSPSAPIAADDPKDTTRTLEAAHKEYRRATVRAQAELDQLRHVAESQTRRRTPSDSLRREDRATASGFTGVSATRQSLPSEDRASDLELHRPTPIAPPNHNCTWKDRYMALTAEIRLLKAQMTDRLSSGEADTAIAVQDHGSRPDEDLGIQGLTIVMHLKGKDDLVINTDLTQDVGGGDE